MIDLRVLRAEPERVRASQRARGEDVELVDRTLAADREHRGALTEFERLRAEQKSFGKRVAQAHGEEKQTLLAQVKDLAAQVKDAEARVGEREQSMSQAWRGIGNVVIDGVPPGGEEEFVTLEEHGTPRDFAAEGFAPADHLSLGERLGILDMARGAKVAGARFYYLVGDGARLEHALMDLALERAHRHGFVHLQVPTLVNPQTMDGAGFLDAHAEEVYRLPTDDLYLTGTSEVALAGYHAQEIVDLDDGPRRYCAMSTCYRREAGSYGKDTRGIIRVHQFTKVEMFTYTRVEDAAAEHEQLLAWEREMLDDMRVPYRVIDIAAGDLGSAAARKYDCEGWVPSQGRYRELTSTSNCTTFQARRLGTRERDPHGSGTRAVATLNGTLATTRWLVALLENGQQADGTVVLPPVLAERMGTEILEPRT